MVSIFMASVVMAIVTIKLMANQYITLILKLGPFITLNVRNGHKLIDWVFRIPAHIESKSRKKNNNQHFIKHDEDNNSQF